MNSTSARAIISHTVKFNDITTRLEPGHTYVFGLTGYHNKAGQPAGVVGLLEIEFSEGAPMIIPTDEHWKVSDHETPGWLKNDFDDSSWVSAQKIGPVGMQPWGDVRSAEQRVLPARYLRKEFSVEKKIARATVSFSGLGLSELYVNGKKIGDHVLSPAFAQYNKRDFAVTYDVTKNLQRGANALGVILGNGRFYADRSKVYAGTVNFGFPKLLLNLHVDYTDGSSSEIVSDASWKLTDRRPHSREQRLRRRTIRRAQGISGLERARDSTTPNGSRRNWFPRPAASFLRKCRNRFASPES